MSTQLSVLQGTDECRTKLTGTYLQLVAESALRGGEHGCAAAGGGDDAHPQAGRAVLKAQRLQRVAQCRGAQPVPGHHPARRRHSFLLYPRILIVLLLMKMGLVQHMGAPVCAPGLAQVVDGERVCVGVRAVPEPGQQRGRRRRVLRQRLAAQLPPPPRARHMPQQRLRQEASARCAACSPSPRRSSAQYLLRRTHSAAGVGVWCHE